MIDFGDMALVLVAIAILNVTFGEMIADVFDNVTSHIKWWSQDLARITRRLVATVAGKLKSRR